MIRKTKHNDQRLEIRVSNQFKAVLRSIERDQDKTASEIIRIALSSYILTSGIMQNFNEEEKEAIRERFNTTAPPYEVILNRRQIEKEKRERAAKEEAEYKKALRRLDQETDQKDKPPVKETFNDKMIRLKKKLKSLSPVSTEFKILERTIEVHEENEAERLADLDRKLINDIEAEIKKKKSARRK